MNTIIRALVSALSLAALAEVPAARADVPGFLEYNDPTAWTHVASACVPDEGASGKYSTVGGDVTFKSSVYTVPPRSATALPAPLRFRCNVTDPMDGKPQPGWNSLIVGYVDPDGVSTDTRVVARLYQVARANGAASIIATFDSNALAQNVRAEALVSLKAPTDFRNNQYFVQLDLYRFNQTALNPVAYSARLVRTEADNIPR